MLLLLTLCGHAGYMVLLVSSVTMEREEERCRLAPPPCPLMEKLLDPRVQARSS